MLGLGTLPFYRLVSPERRNFFCFLIEGSFFIGGLGFVNSQTLLPAIILEENGPAWLASLAPSMLIIGIFSAPVFTVSLVDRLDRMKPLVLSTAAGMRLFYLVAALLFLIPNFPMSLGIWVLAVTPLLCGFVGGLGITAWQRLFAASVPAAMRPANIAWRFLLGGLMGILAGWTISWALENFSTPHALSILHGITFGTLLISLLVLSWVREPSGHSEPLPTLEVRDKGLAVIEGFRILLGQGESRRECRAFLVALVSMHAFFLSTPFFAAYLLHLLDQPPSFLGTLATCQMAGMALGNLVAAWAARRWGARFSFAIGAVLIAAALLAVSVVDDITTGCLVYGLNSMAMMIMVVGKDALVLDFAPQKQPARYYTAVALTTMVSILVISGLGYVLHTFLGVFPIAAAIAAFGTLTCFVALGYVREPRQDVRGDPLRALYRGVLRYLR